MNSNAKAWVKALRSGEYKQGKGVLRNKEDEFCCLGVACDLYCKAVEDIYDPDTESYGGKDCRLPDKVMEWLGLGGGFGDYFGSSLSTKNDNGTSFSDIAGIIESEPEGLFKELQFK